MEGLFLGGSLLAAFLAGSVALFAPCCVTVLFPAYLSAAVRNSRWRLVPLTFIFAAGIAVVLVPVTLGLSFLTRGLLKYQGAIYISGGLLMLVLAALALTGKGWTLPIMRGSPDVRRTDTGGVFALGVFSGAASACCAPVLAGVLALSAVAPNLIQGVGIGLAYVFGMVAPLVILALTWDRFGAGLRDRMQGRERHVRVAGRVFSVTTLNLVAGTMFGLLGVALIGFGVTGATLAPTAQVTAGVWLQERLLPFVRWLDPVPDAVIGLVLIAIAVAAIAISGRRRRTMTQDTTPPERSGHVQQEEGNDEGVSTTVRD